MVKTSDNTRDASRRATRDQRTKLDYLKDVRDGKQSIVESTAIEVVLEPDDLSGRHFKNGKYPVDTDVGSRRCGFNFRPVNKSVASSPPKTGKSKSHLERSIGRLQTDDQQSPISISPEKSKKSTSSHIGKVSASPKRSRKSRMEVPASQLERSLLGPYSAPPPPPPPAPAPSPSEKAPLNRNLPPNSLLDVELSPTPHSGTSKILSRFDSCTRLTPKKADKIQRVSSQVSDYSAPFMLKDDHSLGQNSIDEVQEALRKIEDGLRSGSVEEVSVSSKVYSALRRIALSLASREEQQAMLREISTWNVISEERQTFEEEKKGDDGYFLNDDGVRRVEPRSRPGKDFKYSRKNSTPYARVLSSVSNDASSFSDYVKRKQREVSTPSSFPSSSSRDLSSTEDTTSRVSSIGSKSFHGSWTSFHDPVNTSYFREISIDDDEYDHDGEGEYGKKTPLLRRPPSYHNRDRAWWRNQHHSPSKHTTPHQRGQRVPPDEELSLGSSIDSSQFRHKKNVQSSPSQPLKRTGVHRREVSSNSTFVSSSAFTPLNDSLETDVTSLSRFLRSDEVEQRRSQTASPGEDEPEPRRMAVGEV